MILKAVVIALRKDIIITSIKVSLVVGFILNIINQGDLLFSFQFNKINWLKLLLTFAVPYIVTTYASVKERLKDQ
jgi:Mg/Co/Ni transporter MgtE